jgi:hypothetical protein
MALGALLISVSPNLEVLIVANLTPCNMISAIIREAASPDSAPWLQKLRCIQIRESDASGHGEAHGDNPNSVFHLPSIKAVDMFGYDRDTPGKKIQFPTGNCTELRLSFCNMDLGCVDAIIKSAGKLRVLVLNGCFLWPARQGLERRGSTRGEALQLLDMILHVSSTLEELKLTIHLKSGSDKWHQQGNASGSSSTSKRRRIKKPNLRSFSQLRHLRISSDLWMFYTANSRLSHASDGGSKLEENLPPRLERLSLYNRKEGSNRNRHEQLPTLLSEMQKRLPSLKIVDEFQLFGDDDHDSELYREINRDYPSQVQYEY